MKAAIIGPKYAESPEKSYGYIREQLEKLGVKVDFSYFTTTVEEDSAHPRDTFKKVSNILKNADFIVADTTEYSSGIGFLIGAAYNNRKPVLVLFNKNSGKMASSILRSSSSESKLLRFVEYTSDNLNNVLNGFVNDVKNMIDTKFILIISPEIDRYLEWAADERRMHKAQIVRSAIEDMIERDKEYKQLQKSLGA
jgi:hypothetical protein